MRIDLVQSFLFTCYNVPMIIVGIIIIVSGLALLIISILMMFGKVNLLHSYHRENVKEEDKKMFGITTGLSLSIGALGIIASGILDLIYLDNLSILAFLLTMFIPLGISIILVLIFIKKYNGSIMG